MLQQLTIRNIVLIETLDLSFAGGLTVLTGETGAGKSIVLDALGLALGERAGSGIVRQGEAQGTVSAVFTTPPHPGLHTLFEDQGMEPDDTLTLRRVVYADGKSKAFINDMPASLGLVQSISAYLVEIHGQHESHGLLDQSTHAGILDAFAGVDTRKIAAMYHQVRSLQRQRAELEASLEKARAEQEFMEHALKELKAFAPRDNEELELMEARTQLQQGKKRVEAFADAMAALQHPHNVCEQLRSAERILDRSNPGEEASTILELLDRAHGDAMEAIGLLEDLVEKASSGHGSLEQIEDRLHALRGLARKYQRPSEQLPNYMMDIETQLSMLANDNTALGEVGKAIEQAKLTYMAEAKSLSAKRQKAIKKLEKNVMDELPPLKLAGASFRIVQEVREAEEQWSERGVDAIRFEVQTNPGSPFGALHKVASGGELSRIMLALNVALRETLAIPTLIFDEVDTGIGGAVADAVGKRLALLAERCQLFCITHQPQVASYGDQHYRIRKEQGRIDKKPVTRTIVEVLHGEARQEELARMLAGEEITEEARAAAKRLMEA